MTTDPPPDGPDDDLPRGAVRIDPDWDDDEDEGPDEPRWWESVVAPGPLGLGALALAVLSFLSLAALDVSAEWFSSSNSGSGFKTTAIAATVVHLIVGAVALLVGLGAMYLDDQDDTSWVRTVSRAAVVLAAVGLVLHGIALGLDVHHHVDTGNSGFIGG